jgi:hypothetical protein
MPVLNDASNLSFGGEQVLGVLHRDQLVWVLPVPGISVLPDVTGSTSAPADLSCDTGTWTNTPTSYAYQWQEFTGGVWVDLSGETASTLDDAAAGTYRCKVIASNGFGPSEPAYSESHIVTSGTLREFGFSTAPNPALGFPGSTDRALGSPFTKSHAGTVTAVFARFRSDTTAGASARICAHAAGTNPGALIWETPGMAIPNGGGIVEFDLPLSGISGTDAADDYWLIVVTDSFQADIAKSDTLAEGRTVMANGTYDFDDPPSTWPGTDGNYDGPCSIWCEYLG